MGNPTPTSGGASLSDILTAIKNLVEAVNNASQAYRNVNGISTKEAITVPTVVKTSPGRIAAISVIIAGSAPGTVYDSSQVSVPTAPLYVIPNTVGVFVVNLPTDTGLLVVPGSGQTVTVSWS
jgi:hypothetical protein